MSKIAFTPEEGVDATKEFVGQVIATDYAEEPFGIKGNPSIQRRGKVFAVQIRTDMYEKEQLEWYPPTTVKKTKWLYLIEALHGTGAWKDITLAGKTDDERMLGFARSMLGMKFRWMELVKESLVKEQVPQGTTIQRGFNPGFRKFSVLLPVEYLGKTPIEPKPTEGTVREATIGEGAMETGEGVSGEGLEDMTGRGGGIEDVQ